MATSDFPGQIDAGIGGGGSGWEQNIHNQDVATATPVFNPVTGQYEWRMPDGSLLNAQTGQNGNSPYGPYAGQYRNDPSQMPPPSLQNNPTFYGPGGGHQSSPNGGGGGPSLPLSALAKAAAPLAATAIGRVAGGGGGTTAAQVPPELQQLLALAMKRMSQQQPLFDSINAQAMAGLPTAYQRGGQ